MRKRKLIRGMMILLAAAMTAAGSAGAEQGKVRELPIDMSGGAPYTETFRTNPELYEDPSIRVEYHHLLRGNRKNGSQYIYFYADVTILSPTQLRTAAATEDFTRAARVPGKTIAVRKNAVLAVNGDFTNYGSGNEVNKYCLRQGTVYRETVVENLDMLLIDEDGNFHILKAGPDLAGAEKQEIDGRKVINAFQFGPALVIDGEAAEDEYILNPAHSPASAHPDTHTARMCIAQIDELHYLALAAWDGLDLTELRDLVLSIAPDCRTAYVLDGGNSAQMIFLKSQVNNDGNANDRTITDIIYFASAYFRDE